MPGRLHSLRHKAPLALLIASFAGILSAHAAGYGFDAGQEPSLYAANLASAHLTGVNGGWLRARGIAGSSGEGDHPGRSAAIDREGILALHARGIKVCIILRWPPGEWSHGVRPGGGHRLPLDLREPYERARKVAELYGDIVDAWEIENEPDIGFVLDNPETYAAFFKAASLGIKTGAKTARERAADAATQNASATQQVVALWTRSAWLANKRGVHPRPARDASSVVRLDSVIGEFHPTRHPSNIADIDVRSRVVMAPLALPPGPYFESLWANDVASYTDAFNFHYYGYAEDFTGVYRQFESAVRSTPTPAHSAPRRAVKQKSLPVFITEYGFGLLDADARDSTAGRVRQWQWFTSVARQIHTLRPEAPMAFVLNPYLEGGVSEFGLGMETPAQIGPIPETKQQTSNTHAPDTRSSVATAITSAETQIPGCPTRNSQAETQTSDPTSADKSPVGVAAATEAPPPSNIISAAAISSALPVTPITFAPSNFSTTTVEPWMHRIGEKIGNAHASPALAQLWDYAEKNPYKPRAWKVATTPASSVVIDLVAGPDMVQVKTAGGYSLQSASRQWTPATQRTGRGNWVLYNFSESSVSGILDFAAGSLVTSPTPQQITLAAGERLEIPVEFTVPAEELARHVQQVRFVPAQPSPSIAHFSTTLLPATYTMVTTRVTDLRNITASPFIVAAQQSRTLAIGEPRMQLDGRWLKTEGVRVIDDRQGHWRFEIDHLPTEPLRPAMVELPLPENFEFKTDTSLWFEYRRTPLAPRLENPHSLASVQKPRTAHGINAMDVYFRTANGNLYQTWPRLTMRPQWATYNEDARHFTMSFFGRSSPPWRFSDNKPVALVFFLRPAEIPSAFEVRGASIIKLQEL